MAEYVKKEDVLAKAQWFEMYDGESEDSEFAMKYIDPDDVESIPAAPVVEVVHGRWEAYPSDAFMRCSVCKREYQRIRMPQVVGWCPNPDCGARMDGGS